MQGVDIHKLVVSSDVRHVDGFFLIELDRLRDRVRVRQR